MAHRVFVEVLARKHRAQRWVGKLTGPQLLPTPFLTGGGELLRGSLDLWPSVRACRIQPAREGFSAKTCEGLPLGSLIRSRLMHMLARVAGTLLLQWASHMCAPLPPGSTSTRRSQPCRPTVRLCRRSDSDFAGG